MSCTIIESYKHIYVRKEGRKEGRLKIGGWLAIIGRGLLCTMYICDDIYT